MRRRSRERGSTLIETTMVVGVFLVPLTMGVIEAGGAWQTRMGLETVARSAARVGAALGADRAADYQALQALASGASGLTITEIVVFKSSSSDGSVPTACTYGSSVAGLCNVYTAADLSRPAGNFNGSCTNSPDGAWCPTTRRNTQAGGLDFYGVRIKVRHDWMTSFFPSSLTITATAVMQVEPNQQ